VSDVIEIVFETHSISEDNERGIASGWNHSRLSERGKLLARELGTRRREDNIDAVFSSDLARAVETAHIAFEKSSVPIFLDWRLRECNYGVLNGQSVVVVRGERYKYLDAPYPDGESWRQAVARVSRFFDDVELLRAHARILLVGHVATRWACEHFLNRVRLEDLAAPELDWQAGWEYRRLR
jgi:2,3-bisphosphoglycerate-dependent phosphoglycerate mutase